MISIRRDGLYGLDVAAKLVRYDDAWCPKLLDPSGEKPSRGLGVAPSLNQNIENITVSINRTPEPEFLSANGDDDLIHMPLVIRLGPVPADAGGKMAGEAIDPQSNSSLADDDASLGKQVLNIGCAQGKAMIGSDRISDNLTRKSKPFQPAKSARQFHGPSINDNPPPNNLAIPP